MSNYQSDKSIGALGKVSAYSGCLKTQRPITPDDISWESTGLYVEYTYKGTPSQVRAMLDGMTAVEAGMISAADAAALPSVDVPQGSSIVFVPSGNEDGSGTRKTISYVTEVTNTYSIDAGSASITQKTELVRKVLNTSVEATDDEEEDESGDSGTTWEDSTYDISCSSTMVETSVLSSDEFAGLSSTAAKAVKEYMDGASLDDYIGTDRIQDLITADTAATDFVNNYLNKGKTTYWDVRTEVTMEKTVSSAPVAVIGTVRGSISGVSLKSRRNWLCTGVSWNNKTKKASLTYLASAPGGWDRKILGE